jgi:hypothetical protein
MLGTRKGVFNLTELNFPGSLVPQGFWKHVEHLHSSFCSHPSLYPLWNTQSHAHLYLNSASVPARLSLCWEGHKCRSAHKEKQEDVSTIQTVDQARIRTKVTDNVQQVKSNSSVTATAWTRYKNLPMPNFFSWS